MKTLLIATDLSESAARAATYGYALAQQLKAKVILCHVMNVPAEIPQTGMVAWPEDVYEDMLRDSKNELAKLKNQLIASGRPNTYQPEVVCVYEAGFAADVINDKASHFGANMVITGTHANDSLTTMMMGNHTRKLIEASTVPLLLVPPSAEFKPLKRIAFASDFAKPARDIKPIHELIDFAKSLDTEVILAHIDEHKNDPGYDAIVREMLSELMGKLNREKVSYKVVNSDNVEGGLKWLTDHAAIDILAMVHRRHNVLESLFAGSHTQKAARHLALPLLVLKS